MVHPNSPPFLEAIRDALAGAGIEHARARWSAHPPAPWHAWLLVALARQVSAQRWATRLWDGPLAGADGYGPVPGARDWRYSIEGIRLSLFGPDNETIEVDDHGDDGSTIDAHCFTRRLLSLPEPALPEQRLLDILPLDVIDSGEDILLDAIEQVAATGLIERGQHPQTFRIAPALDDAAEAIAALDFSARGVRDRWAEHLGDHLLLADDRAPAQRLALARYLVAGLERMPAGFLKPLDAWLQPAEFVEVCAKVIDGPLALPAGNAIKRLEAHPDYPACPAVARLLERADPARDYPYVIHLAARYLLRRGLDRPLAVRSARAFAEVEVVRGCDDNPMVGDLGLLLLEHAPAYALPAIRRGLRTRDWMAQQTVATALALLDQPWCHRELFRALNEATIFEGTAALRQALRRSSALHAREVVQRWEQTHARLHPPATTFPPDTWAEVLEMRAARFFDDEAEHLRAWAEAVRPAIDPDFDRVASA